MIDANDFEAQIKQLRQEVSNNPSLENLKKVLKFSMEYSRDVVTQYSKEFKQSILSHNFRKKSI